MDNFDLFSHSPQYIDDFIAGWNCHKCGIQIDGIEGTVKFNNKYYTMTGQEHRITTGMIDGWKMRDSNKIVYNSVPTMPKIA